jgi:two-component system NarL family response regulator
MEKVIKIVIIEDQRILREMLSYQLSSIQDFEVIGEWNDAESSFESPLTASADVAVVDIRLPLINGIEFTFKAKTRYPNLKCIIMTAYEDEALIHEAFNAGAVGYITKNVSFDDISYVIRTVYKGQSFLSPDLTKNYIEWMKNQHSFDGYSFIGYPHEHIAILRMARDGMTNKEIAAQLKLPLTTVKSHFSSIMKKLNTSDRTSCIVKALRYGIIDIQEHS